MRKAVGGGMSAAAALMAANTKPTRKLVETMPFEWLFNFYLDRPQRFHRDLLDHSDALPPLTLLLKVAQHRTPDVPLVMDVFSSILKAHPNSSRAPPNEEEEMHEVSQLLDHELFSINHSVRVVFVQVLLRRKVYSLAMRELMKLPDNQITAALWRDAVDAVATGRFMHGELIYRLLNETVFPVSFVATSNKYKDAFDTTNSILYGDDGPGSQSAVSLYRSSPLQFGLEERVATKVMLVLSSFPSLVHLVLQRYLKTAHLMQVHIHPTPILAFLKVVQEVKDAETKLPMIHWKHTLRYFQLLNRSCPHWYLEHPHEAAEVVKYVIMTCSAGADPFLTMNIARVAASRHILDGVELSIWFVTRMTLSHHVEETKAVASRLLRWLFHTVGIHLQQKYHPQLISIARSLVNIDGADEVVKIYNIVIDHIELFSNEFRQQWMATMRDLVCVFCGTVFPHSSPYEDRTCVSCMHVTPAKTASEPASYELTEEHLEYLRKKRRAAMRESRQRVIDFAMSSPSSRQGTSAPQNLKAPEDLFKSKILSPNAEMEIGSVVAMPSLVLGPGASSVDVRAAVEESKRRTELVAQLRAMQMQQLGRVPDASTASVPSTITNLVSATKEHFRAVREQAVLKQLVRLDGAWRCVWCQEENTAFSDSRVKCVACGADTGPEAQWRAFQSDSSGDVLKEICLRIRSGNAADALVAAYNLMVYRKMFLLVAGEEHYALADQLIRRLVLLQERVLAGYLFMRLIPPSLRPRCLETMTELATLFGNQVSFLAALQADTLKLHVDQQVFDGIFGGEKTCKVCFGTHSWQVCPIVTRDFSTTRVSINLTEDEKKLVAFNRLKELVTKAVACTVGDSRIHKGDITDASRETVQIAYQTFVTSKREQFAAQHPVDANHLSRALSFIGEYVRAAFVILHIPLHLRFNATYSDLSGYFGVAQVDCASLLKKRSAIGVMDVTHPNFVQVVRTCCVCLSSQHASFLCDRLASWKVEVMKLFAVETNSTSALVDEEHRRSRTRVLHAQAGSWINSGPERLHAFQRFLLEHLESLIQTKVEVNSPIIDACNRTVVRLVETQQMPLALCLYSRLPSAFVHASTTAAILSVVGFSQEDIQRLSVSSTGGRDSTCNHKEVCLCCFESGHVFYQCPDVLRNTTNAQRIKHVVETVGVIRSSNHGIRAAADFLYNEYNFGRLSPEMLRSHPDLVQSILRLMQRCFASKQISRGVRLLRRIPIEMLEVKYYETMWKACGLPLDIVSERCHALSQLFDEHNLKPSSTTSQPRLQFPQDFITNVAALIHADQCRHCYEHGHTIAECDVFHAEASFGRDFLSCYRTATMMVSLYPHERLCLFAHLLRFALAHQMVLPHYIHGVHKGLNALSASFSMEREPGLGLRALLSIPPAYRQRHAMHYALHAFGVHKLNCMKLLDASNFLITGDSPAPLLHHRGSEHATGTASADAAIESQHLLVLRRAIPDVLFDQIFAPVQGAANALQHADERMHELIHAGLCARPAPHSVDEETDMKLAVDFAHEIQNMMKQVGCKVSAGVAATSMIAEPSSKEQGPREKKQSETLAQSTIPLAQSCDIVELREAFEPIISFMENLIGVKLGSRQDIMMSQIELEFPLAVGGGDDTSRTKPSSSSSQNSHAHQSNKSSSTEKPADQPEVRDHTTATATAAAGSRQQGNRAQSSGSSNTNHDNRNWNQGRQSAPSSVQSTERRSEQQQQRSSEPRVVEQRSSSSDFQAQPRNWQRRGGSNFSQPRFPLTHQHSRQSVQQVNHPPQRQQQQQQQQQNQQQPPLQQQQQHNQGQHRQRNQNTPHRSYEDGTNKQRQYNDHHKRQQGDSRDYRHRSQK